MRLGGQVHTARGIETDIAGSPGNVHRLGQLHGLAIVAALCCGEAVQVAVDKVGEAQQHLGALLGRLR